MITKLAFVTYETPFAPCGGIAAVMGRLPKYMQQASRSPVVVITPLHYNIHNIKSSEAAFVGNVSVRYKNDIINVNIIKKEGEVNHYFLLPDDSRFFAGVNHPYNISTEPMENRKLLLRDGLLFGAAVARSIHVIGPGVRWIILMQDWEAATTALALTQCEHPHQLFLTLHNSYDREINFSDVNDIGFDQRAESEPFGLHARSASRTVLECAISILDKDKPIFTVSEQFASEFAEQAVEKEAMDEKLRGLLQGRFMGIDNGPFCDLAVDDEALTDAIQGNFRRLQDWKVKHRIEAIKALTSLVPNAREPVWGDPVAFTEEIDLPWFIMAGRDDAKQKGYDVAAFAVKNYLEDGGNGKFLFFPIPGVEGEEGLYFLKNLVDEHLSQVLVLPFLFRDGYLLALRGSTYGIMPSFYEPFGMANEYYLNGTVGIGRATGGILEQIVPLAELPAYSDAVRGRTYQKHKKDPRPTGLLYREKDPQGEEEVDRTKADWQKIGAITTAYSEGGGDRVHQKKDIKLFEMMADELRKCIQQGENIFIENPDLYYRMLTDGVNYIRHKFFWEKAAHEYLREIGTPLKKDSANGP